MIGVVLWPTGLPFDNLEEAQAEARSDLEQQRRAGALLNVIIEEKESDGTVVTHVVALSNPARCPQTNGRRVAPAAGLG